MTDIAKLAARVWQWDGWRVVGLWLYQVALVLWGMWLGCGWHE